MNEAWRVAALAFIGQAIPAYLLILARTVGMLQQAPVLGSRTVPQTARAGLAIALSLVYFLSLTTAPAVPHAVLNYFLVLLDELGMGLIFGFAAMIMFFAFQAAGELVANQTGLSMMTTLNPSLRTQTTAVGNLFFYLSQTAFLALGGHLWFLKGYYQTFDLVPLGGFVLTPGVWEHASKLILAFFFIVVQLAMPAVVIMFLVDFGLGIINRSSPSVQNILEIVQAVKPTVGFLVLTLMVPNTVGAVGQWADRMLKDSQAIAIVQASPLPQATARPGLSP